MITMTERYDSREIAVRYYNGAWYVVRHDMYPRTSRPGDGTLVRRQGHAMHVGIRQGDGDRGGFVTRRYQLPDTGPATPASQRYLVTANVNVAPRMAGMVDGYQPRHPVATVGWYDVWATSFDAAANAMWAIGNRERADLDGQTWPSDVRSLSVGDVLYIADPVSAVRILAVARLGWREVPQPPDRLQVELAGTEATSRR